MVTTEEDINRIIGELRVAISEHIQLTKAELEGQASTISLLESKAA